MTLWYVFTFLLSVLIVSLVLYLVMERQLLNDIDRFILDETNELAEAHPQESEGSGSFERFEEEVDRKKILSLFFQILDEKAQPVYRYQGF